MSNQYIRALYTVADYLVLLLLNSFVYNNSSFMNFAVFFIFFPILITVLQFYNCTSMGLFGSEYLILLDGRKMKFNSLLLRNIIKPIIILLYMSILPLFWILYPLNLSWGLNSTPFDKLFGTRTSKIPQNTTLNFLISKKNLIFEKFLLSITNFFASYNDSHKTSTNLQIVKSRILALYLIWFFIHFYLYIFSGKRTINSYCEVIVKLRGEYQYTTNQDLFFPLDRCDGNILHGVYDYSEFLFYTITPVLLYFVIKLWKNNLRIVKQ